MPTPGHRRRRGDGERGRRRVLPARRHPHSGEREDDRDHQHGRGRTSRPGRRSPLRAAARRHTSRRPRDVDRRDGARARRLLRRRLRKRRRMADARRRVRRGERRPRVAVAAPLSLSALHRLGLRRSEELQHSLSGRSRVRGGVPARVRGRRPVGAHRHGRHRFLHVAAPRLPLAARRYGLRRPPALRARAQAEHLNFDLTREQQLVRDTVRQFAESRIAPVAAELDREHSFPYDLVAALAELGLMGMTIPEEYGGAGADTVSYAIAVEELTRIDSSVAITVAAHHSLGTLPIFYFGTEEQKQEWLPELAAGKQLAAFGLTEPGASSGSRTWRPKSRQRGTWSTEPRGRRIRAARSARRQRSRSSTPARCRIASSTGLCSCTAATATWTSSPFRASTATRRSSRSVRAQTKSSVWLSRGTWGFELDFVCPAIRCQTSVWLRRTIQVQRMVIARHL